MSMTMHVVHTTTTMFSFCYRFIKKNPESPRKTSTGVMALLIKYIDGFKEIFDKHGGKTFLVFCCFFFFNDYPVDRGFLNKITPRSILSL